MEACGQLGQVTMMNNNIPFVSSNNPNGNPQLSTWVGSLERDTAGSHYIIIGDVGRVFGDENAAESHV